MCGWINGDQYLSIFIDNMEPANQYWSILINGVVVQYWSIMINGDWQALNDKTINKYWSIVLWFTFDQLWSMVKISEAVKMH